MNIKDKIHTFRGVQIILDRDLAEMYEVETKQLNRAVKRNIERFPEGFRFQLIKEEENSLISQNEILNKKSNLRFQNGTSKSEQGGRRYLPYAFTEQGVAMLSGVLRSKKAIEVSIQIMEAFVAMRKFISKNAELFVRLDGVDRKLIEHDEKFDKVFDALEVHIPSRKSCIN